MCNPSVTTADKEPGGEEAVGALPQEADCRKSSSFTPTEGKNHSAYPMVCFCVINNVSFVITNFRTLYKFAVVTVVRSLCYGPSHSCSCSC